MRGMRSLAKVIIMVMLFMMLLTTGFAQEPTVAQTESLEPSTEQSNEWPNQGAVYVTKEAMGTATAGRYIIELEVMGKNVTTTSDVVLILDDSGSMEGSVGELKDAAKSFVSNLLEKDSTKVRIAIVSINGSGSNGTAGVLCDYSDDVALLNTAIDTIGAAGGTNLHGGLWEARKLMESSNADNKNVIIMSDGEPTFSHKPIYEIKTSFQPVHNHDTDAWSPSEINADDITFQNQIDYNVLIGDGDSYDVEVFSYDHTCEQAHTQTFKYSDNHGTQAIYEAKLIKDQGIDVYSVGFRILDDPNAASVLKNCSSGDSYYAASKGELTQVFNSIGTKIICAASDVVVSDPMSDYVELEIDGASPTWAVGTDPSIADVVVTSGEIIFAQNESDNKYTLTWKLPLVAEQYEDDEVTPKGEKLMYYVTVLSDVDPAKTYPTNKDTIIEYTGVDGTEGLVKNGFEDGSSGDFTIPYVSSGKGVVNVVYYRVNEIGEPVNSLNEVVPSEVQAQQISAFRYTKDESEALDIPASYEITPDASCNFNDVAYYLHDSFGATSASLTVDDNIKTVYFGYCPRYEIIWENENGEVLEIDSNVAHGVLPQYDGQTPTKEETERGTYNFIGWSPQVSQASKNITYVAQYFCDVNTYTIKWANWNDDILEEDLEVPYGQVAKYDGQTPTRDATDQYTYIFSGWNPQVVQATEDITYKAVFKSVVNEYNVKWVNWNDDVLEDDLNVAYGQTPNYDGQTPIRATTEQYTYTFSGWNPQVVQATGDVTYKAQYSSEINEHSVIWVDWDDDVLEEDLNVPYGQTPQYDGQTPKRSSTAKYKYTFSGWDKEISQATGDVIYKAQYSSEINKYKVKWLDWNGYLLEEDLSVPYGQMPSYDGQTPTKDPVGQYIHIFDGWTPNVSQVTGNISYIADFVVRLETDSSSDEDDEQEPDQESDDTQASLLKPTISTDKTQVTTDMATSAQVNQEEVDVQEDEKGEEIERILENLLPENAPVKVIKKLIWWPLLLLLLLLNNVVITYYDKTDDGFKKRKKSSFRFRGKDDEAFRVELKNLKTGTYKAEIMIRSGLSKRISDKSERKIFVLSNSKIIKRYEMPDDHRGKVDFIVVPYREKL